MKVFVANASEQSISGGETPTHKISRSTAPLFTVVTAVYNGEGTIKRAIKSVSAQTFEDYEYIVVDGGSSDGTVSKIREQSDHIDYWVSEPDSGVYNAWNKAVRQARGEWISFLGADDQYEPDALEQYAKAIALSSTAHFVSSRVHLMRNKEICRTIGGPWRWPAFARHMTIAHVGAQHHKSLFQEAGLFDESYRICGDYELLLRLKNRLRAIFIDSVTAKMQSGGMSSSNIAVALSETERAKRDTAGRNRFLCSFERKEALLRGSWRALRRQS